MNFCSLLPPLEAVPFLPSQVIQCRFMNRHELNHRPTDLPAPTKIARSVRFQEEALRVFVKILLRRGTEENPELKRMTPS